MIVIVYQLRTSFLSPGLERQRYPLPPAFLFPSAQLKKIQTHMGSQIADGLGKGYFTMFSTSSPLSSLASWSTTVRALSDWISCVAAPMWGVMMTLSSM